MEELAKHGREELLGGNVDDFDDARIDGLDGFEENSGRERAGENDGGQNRRKLVLLIVHQRNERRNNQRNSAEKERGKLIGQRFPASSRGNKKLHGTDGSKIRSSDDSARIE